MMSGFINSTTRSRQKMPNLYPTGLPAPLKADRSFQMVDPLVSSASDNGQTRWDRRFTDVPTATPVSWIFTDQQCSAFEAWYRDVLRDGAEWFEMPLTTAVGREPRECHFLAAYSGPERLGPDRWRITADITLRRRPLLPPGWGNFPEYILNSCVIDIALNLLWPQYTFDYPTYAALLADIRNLRDGARFSVKADETQGGQHSYYAVDRADSPSLSLDFLSQTYQVGSGADNLILVVTYAR